MIRENNTLEWQETAEQKRMTQRRIIQRRERARRRKRKVWRIRGLLLLFGCLLFLGGVRRFRQNPIQRYAKANGISMDQYPEELLSLYERNNETETFVEEYPLKKDGEPEIDLSDLSSASEVPLLLQWDQRWGYHRYAGEVMGLSGCGPTALSHAGNRVVSRSHCQCCKTYPQLASGCDRTGAFGLCQSKGHAGMEGGLKAWPQECADPGHYDFGSTVKCYDRRICCCGNGIRVARDRNLNCFQCTAARFSCGSIWRSGDIGFRNICESFGRPFLWFAGSANTRSLKDFG